MKVKFDEKTGKWIELPLHSKDGIYLDGYLKMRLDAMKSLQRKQFDSPMICDGEVGVGKSRFLMTIGYYLADTKFDEKNICAGNQDAIEKMRKLPDGSAILIDEGSLVFNAKETMRREQVRLTKILDVCRQRRFYILVACPSFFDLNKYIAVFRSRFLIHCYTDTKFVRGRFAYWGTKKKKILYSIGKKNFGSYKKPKADFIGRFMDFNPIWVKKYEAIKRKSMEEALADQSEKITAGMRKTIIKQQLKNMPQMQTKIPMADLEILFGIKKRAIFEYKAELREESKNETTKHTTSTT